MTQVPASETPSRHVTVIIVLPSHLFGRNGQGLAQPRINLPVIQIIVMTQELCQSIDVAHVKLPGTAKHGPTDIVHAEFEHAFGGHPAFHSQKELGRYTAILPQHTQRRVRPRPLAPLATGMLSKAAFAIGGGSDVVFAFLAFQDVDGAPLDTRSNALLELIPVARQMEE